MQSRKGGVILLFAECVTSRQNSVVKRFRDVADDCFTVEGYKLSAEALSAGFIPCHALFTRQAEEKYSTFLNELSQVCRVNVISGDLSEYISDTKTPQGVFVMFGRKAETPALLCSEGSRRLIVLDGVRDPGNIGAIMRSCEAFGFDGIALSEHSADVFGGKVMRASAGSCFRLKCHRGSLAGVIPELKKSGFTVYAADLDKSAVSLREVEFSGKCAVVIGSEGQGISKDVLALADVKVYIPISGAESLNAGVAAGIICYAACYSK